MYRKILKYTTLVIILVVVVINSVYLKDLDEVKAALQSTRFDAAAYAEDFWEQKLIPSLGKATDLGLLVSLLKKSPGETFEKHSHALGIGNIRFFLVKGQGKVTDIHENTVSIRLEGEADLTAKIATEYIFGNAVRDASGELNINEFDNTMDFNNVSAQINSLIRQRVLPDFNAAVEQDAIVEFSGAIELNKAHLNIENIEIIPITLEVLSTGDQPSL